VLAYFVAHEAHHRGQIVLVAEDRAALTSVVGRLEAAWNAMDGVAFAAPFASDADFVTIRGEHFRGRPAIAAGHAAIFRTIYAGSTNQCIQPLVKRTHPTQRSREDG
jgi:uncharacterized protein (TIGR02246 family)